MFFNNGITDAIKTQARIPCRWHKLSRSGFLLGFVPKSSSWMLNLCQGSISGFGKDACHGDLLAVRGQVRPHAIPLPSLKVCLGIAASLAPRPLAVRYFSMTPCLQKASDVAARGHCRLHTLFTMPCGGFIQWLLNQGALLQVNNFSALFFTQRWAGQMLLYCSYTLISIKSCGEWDDTAAFIQAARRAWSCWWSGAGLRVFQLQCWCSEGWLCAPTHEMPSRCRRELGGCGGPLAGVS